LTAVTHCKPLPHSVSDLHFHRPPIIVAKATHNKPNAASFLAEGEALFISATIIEMDRLSHRRSPESRKLDAATQHRRGGLQWLE
jgi:hypothetical protein